MAATLIRSAYRKACTGRLCGFRTYASQKSAIGASNLSLYVAGGSLVAGVVAYSYWKHSSKRISKLAGINVMQNVRAEEYKKEGAVHPEAEAEETLVAADTNQTESTEGSVTTSEESPSNESIPDIPDFAPYVLIGAGTASYAAAKAIRKKDPSSKVLIIGNEEYTPYSRPPLSKQLWLYEDHEAAKQLKFKASWSGGKLVDVFYKADFCSPRELPFKEGGGIAVVTGRKVTSLNPQKKKISLDNGYEITYNKCLIATGGCPKTLPVFDKGFGDKVSTYRTIPDYQSLDSLLDQAKSILIVGGGFLGSELSVGLANRGKEKGVSITQIFPEVGNLGLVLPETISKWTTDKVKNEGVDVLTGTSIKSAAVENDRVKVITSNDTEIIADHVVVAVGIEPNTELAKSARLEVDPNFGGFKVNRELQACTDVWAAGDVASFYDPYLGRRRVEHHDHANVSGRLAGYNMTGSNEPFLHQSMFWSDVGPEVGFEATGIIDAKLPTVGVWARKSSETMDTPEDDYSKGVVYYLEKEEGRIVGVLTWNIFGKMDVAKQIISEEKSEADIGELSSHFEIIH